MQEIEHSDQSEAQEEGSRQDTSLENLVVSEATVEHASDYEPVSPLGAPSNPEAQRALAQIKQDRLDLAKYVTVKNGIRTVQYWLL